MFPSLGPRRRQPSIFGGSRVVLVHDPAFAHHSLSPQELMNAKFSPGLGQVQPHQQQPSQLRLRPRVDTSFSPRAGGTPRRYGGSHSGTPGANPNDDDDEHEDLAQLRRAARPHAITTPSQPAQPAQTSFDPKSVVVPRVPLAADAALHKPGGGAIKIFSKKLDLSHVVSTLPTARGVAAVPPPRVSDVKIWSDPAARGKYDHVTAKVPSASDAALHKPAGGDVIIPRRSVDWQAETTLPISAAEAARYKPRTRVVPIFSSKVDFTSDATHSEQVVSAREAAKYRPRGGDGDVFMWQQPAEARRPPPPKKTEAQLLEELFPSGAPIAVTDDSGIDEEKKTQPQPVTGRRRRDLLLKMD